MPTLLNNPEPDRHGTQPPEEPKNSNFGWIESGIIFAACESFAMFLWHEEGPYSPIINAIIHGLAGLCMASGFVSIGLKISKHDKSIWASFVIFCMIYAGLTYKNMPEATPLVPKITPPIVTLVTSQYFIPLTNASFILREKQRLLMKDVPMVFMPCLNGENEKRFFFTIKNISDVPLEGLRTYIFIPKSVKYSFDDDPLNTFRGVQYDGQPPDESVIVRRTKEPVSAHDSITLPYIDIPTSIPPSLVRVTIQAKNTDMLNYVFVFMFAIHSASVTNAKPPMVIEKKEDFEKIIPSGDWKIRFN